jgi:hypothetical protein
LVFIPSLALAAQEFGLRIPTNLKQNMREKEKNLR